MKPDNQNNGGVEEIDSAASADLGSIPDFRVIPITLTFDGYPPFKFKFRRQVSQEVKDARQAYYALPDEEQKVKLKDYRADILAQIAMEKPSGVPNFPEGDDLVEAHRQYFTDPDNEDVLQWVWSQYQEKLYPKELLSSVSE